MMLQKIAGSSQTIRAPKGLLRAGAPSPRRQMTSKMAPAQQSSSLLLLLLFLSNRFFCFSLPPSFSLLLLFQNQLPHDLWRFEFFFLLFFVESFAKFVLWGIWRPQFNLCLCLYWFHKALVISATCVIPLLYISIGNHGKLIGWLLSCCYARSLPHHPLLPAQFFLQCRGTST